MSRSCVLVCLTVFGLVLPTLAHPTAEPAASPEQVTPLLIGAPAPTPTLRSSDGGPYDLAQALRGKPTVLILYRGGW